MKVRLGLVLAFLLVCACAARRPASPVPSRTAVTPAAVPAEAAVSPASETEGALSPVMLETRRRWEALIDRPDVHQAILRVGRVDRYALVGRH